jgi:hypothetical protein
MRYSPSDVARYLAGSLPLVAAFAVRESLFHLGLRRSTRRLSPIQSARVTSQAAAAAAGRTAGDPTPASSNAGMISRHGQ